MSSHEPRIKDNNLMTLGARAAQLVTALHQKSQFVFDLDDVCEITGQRRDVARSFVRGLVHRGVATRLKAGLFILVPFDLAGERVYTGNPLLIARKIMAGEDYYVSHGSAMDLHGMLTQPCLVFTVTSPARRASVTVLGMEFRFVHCKQAHLFGLKETWLTQHERMRISDIERTILDGLKQPEYCGGVLDVAKGMWIKRSAVDVEKLIDYVDRLDVGAVRRRLGYLLELYGMADERQLERLRGGLTATYVLLDPLLPAEGKHVRRWRLRLNVSPEELVAATES